MHNAFWTSRLAAILLLMLAVSCRSTSVSPTPASMPAAVAVTAAPSQRFEDATAGIAFMYPAGWKTVAGSKLVLMVSMGTGQLSLDVPTLPFHIPGLIPIDKVRSGYVDNMKKRMLDLVETDLPDPTLPGAKQRRTKLSGHINGKPAIDEAVLIVHEDKVYILAVDSDDAGYPAAKAALDAAVNSLQWIK